MNAPASRIRGALPLTLSTLIGTAYLALLLSLSNRGGWHGYAAGLGDHTVLMPQGLAWANPDAFQNDWFMQVAPQPHWFFDLLIAAGSKLGAVDFFLLIYWLLGLAAFSLATLLLARLLMPNHQLIAAFLVFSFGGLSPWMLFGTGTGFIGMALPTVLASSLIYLTFVLMMLDRWISAAILGIAVSIVHVQQGSIIAIVFFATLVLQFFIRRKVNRPLLIGFIGSSAFVVFGLRLRPVAANLSDFVDVCNSVIPYHCSAWTWAWDLQFATVGGIILASLTVFSFPRKKRLLWASTIGLVLLGIALGFSMDALSVPVLGPLAQAVNVYRLGSVVVPFMLWGFLIPICRPGVFSRRHNSTRSPGRTWLRTLLLWGCWAAAVVLLVLDPGWGLRELLREYPLILVSTLVLIAVAAVVALIRARAFLPWLAVSSLLAVFLGGSIAAQTLTTTPTFNWYQWGHSDLRDWSNEVNAAVPVGATLMSDGGSELIRLYSERATVADCKNIPYGGEAWKEWLSRTRELGICGSPISFSALSMQELEQLAAKYDAQYVILSEEMRQRLSPTIERNGWQLVVEPSPTASNLSVYQLP